MSTISISLYNRSQPFLSCKTETLCSLKNSSPHLPPRSLWQLPPLCFLLLTCFYDSSLLFHGHGRKQCLISLWRGSFYPQEPGSPGCLVTSSTFGLKNICTHIYLHSSVGYSAYVSIFFLYLFSLNVLRFLFFKYSWIFFYHPLLIFSYFRWIL